MDIFWGSGRRNFRGILLMLSGMLILSAEGLAKEKKPPEKPAENTAAPVWFLDRTLAFPEPVYVSASGSGFSEASARDDATAQISLYFESQITVSRSSGADIRKSGNTVLKNGFSDSLTKITSEAALPGILFTEPFQSGGTYHVCAYLSRSECALSLAMQAERALSQAESAVARFRDSAVSLGAVPALREAQGRIQSAEKTVLLLSVLEPKKSADCFAALDRLAAECAERSAEIRSRLTVSVEIEGDRDSLIKNTLRQIFSEAGFSCLETGGRCTVYGNITAEESQNKIGFFVRPGILIRMTENGKTVSTYARQYEKYGHRTMDAAYRKAWIEMEKDLKANLMKSVESGK